MNDTRTTLASYQAQQKGIADQAHQLHIQEWGYANQIHELKQRIIKDENLLQANTWKFGRTMLSFYLDGGRDEDWYKLMGLIGYSSFGLSFDFPDGTKLYINDGELRLSFENAEAGCSFIKEYELAVDTSRLASAIQVAEEELRALRALNEYLPLKGGKKKNDKARISREVH